MSWFSEGFRPGLDFPSWALIETEILRTTFLLPGVLLPRSSGVSLTVLTMQQTEQRRARMETIGRRQERISRASYQVIRPVCEQADPHPMNPSSFRESERGGLPDSRKTGLENQ